MKTPYLDPKSAKLLSSKTLSKDELTQLTSLADQAASRCEPLFYKQDGSFVDAKGQEIFAVYDLIEYFFMINNTRYGFPVCLEKESDEPLTNIAKALIDLSSIELPYRLLRQWAVPSTSIGG
jgi:hypothetical protein